MEIDLSGNTIISILINISNIYLTEEKAIKGEVLQYKKGKRR